MHHVEYIERERERVVNNYYIYKYMAVGLYSNAVRSYAKEHAFKDFKEAPYV